MFRLAAKSIRHNPKRLIFMAASVALGVMLVAATQTFTAALSSGFNSLFSNIYGDSDIIVEADTTAATASPNSTDNGTNNFGVGTPIFTNQNVSDVAAVSGVQDAAGMLQVPLATPFIAKDAESSRVSDFFATPSQLFGWNGNPKIDRATLVDGEAPSTDSQIVMDVDSIKKLGYQIGDSIDVPIQSGNVPLTIVGTVRFGENNNLQGATLAYVTQNEAKKLADTTKYQTISVIASSGQNLDDLAKKISTVIPDGTRAVTGQQKASEQSSSFDDALSYVNIVTIVFAIIALFVGSYIILNTFRIVVTQRTREFGLLRAIGMKGGQVLRMILTEAILVGVMASTFGILLGWGLALGVTALLGALGTNLFGVVFVPTEAIIWSYALGIAVTVFSALAPALSAARVSPMEALRAAGTQARKKLTTRNVVGSILALIGIGLIIFGVVSKLDNAYLFVGLGGGIVVIGITLLAAQILLPVARGLRGVLTTLFRVSGKLAVNNIHQEPRRSANTAAALMIGVMLLALVSTFTASLKTSVSEQITGSDADAFVVATQGGISDDVVAQLKNVNGVEKTVSTADTPATYDGKAYTYFVMDDRPGDSKIAGINSDPSFDQVGDGVFVSPKITKLGVKVGDTVTITVNGETASLPVTGKVTNEVQGDFFVSWNTNKKFDPELEPKQTALIFSSNVSDPSALIDQINSGVLSNYPTLVAFPPTAFLDFINSFLDLILNIITALLAAALIIAVLGVANTLLLSVTERTREIGLLRAVGLRRSEVRRMIVIESVVMSLFGAVIGMILGVSIGGVMVTTLTKLGLSTPTIPWESLAIYTVLAIIAGIVAAIWPARRAARMDILSAIAADG